MGTELGQGRGREVGPDLGAHLRRGGCQEEGNVP